MFTGLVKDIGTITKMEPNEEGCLISVCADRLIEKIVVDDSVSINGVCQTVIAKERDTFEVQCVHVSLEKTTLGRMKVGSKVNLELALQLSDRLGGHLVQGHVNGVASVCGIEKKGENYQFRFKLSPEFSKYIVQEGSIAIDGVSLTIARTFRETNSFEVSIIPHTFNFTNFSDLKIGSEVNIEVDMIAKYVENFLRQNKGFLNESRI